MPPTYRRGGKTWDVFASQPRFMLKPISRLGSFGFVYPFYPRFRAQWFRYRLSWPTWFNGQYRCSDGWNRTTINPHVHCHKPVVTGGRNNCWVDTSLPYPHRGRVIAMYVYDRNSVILSCSSSMRCSCKSLASRNFFANHSLNSIISSPWQPHEPFLMTLLRCPFWSYMTRNAYIYGAVIWLLSSIRYSIAILTCLFPKSLRQSTRVLVSMDLWLSGFVPTTSNLSHADSKDVSVLCVHFM